MYAVIKQGGHQYRVAPEDVIQIEKIDAEPGSELTLGEVLLVADGEKTEVGQPLLEGAPVKAKVLKQDKSKKIDVYKFKRRKGYEKSYGHRQPYTEVRVVSIDR